MIPNTTKSLLLALTVTLTGFAASGAVYADTAGAALTKEAQAAITPAKALEMLKQGNERFVGGKTMERDYLAQVKQTAAGQFPFAAVVSCLDSRSPPAIVFDRGIGDLFVARVAGNFVNDDILGSLEFATKPKHKMLGTVPEKFRKTFPISLSNYKDLYRSLLHTRALRSAL